MPSVRAVTVYCSASEAVPPVYLDSARDLGRAVARQGWTLVYGGNNVGSMGRLADGARSAGGKVVGVTPQSLVDAGIADGACDELIVTATMRQRKALLEERGDAFVALPGGLGTFEEVFEILVGRVLGCHDKPILLLNVADYYRPLLAMIDHGIEHRFIKPRARDAFQIVSSVEQAIVALRNPPRLLDLGATNPLVEPQAPSAVE